MEGPTAGAAMTMEERDREMALRLQREFEEEERAAFTAHMAEHAANDALARSSSGHHGYGHRMASPHHRGWAPVSGPQGSAWVQALVNIGSIGIFGGGHASAGGSSVITSPQPSYESLLALDDRVQKKVIQ